MSGISIDHVRKSERVVHLRLGTGDDDDAVHNVLAVAAPRESTEVTLPMELDLAARAALYLLRHTVVIHGELELVGLDGGVGVLAVVAGLNHLALVGLEDVPLFLEVIDVSFVHTFAVNIAELDVNKRCEGEYDNDADPNKCFFHYV